MMSQNVQSEGSTSPLHLLISTNAKRTELSVACEHVNGLKFVRRTPNAWD